MKNKYYLIALHHINGIGLAAVKKILQRWPNLEDFFKLRRAELINLGFSEQLAQNIRNFNFNMVEKDLRWQELDNNTIICWGDTNYPTLLQEIAAAPIMLYAKGNLDALKQPTVAIVGTRNPSITGKETAHQIAQELAEQKVTIVSGLALGIDGSAHMGALNAAGSTIAVLGTGVDVIYPSKHLKMAQKIVEKGLLLSEFHLGCKPEARHFPRRNRIISGLSLCTLVVEAAVRSGSLITAKYALEQNRDVLAIPSSIYNQQAKGCHYLLQQGAKLITSSREILEEIKGYQCYPEKLEPNIPDIKSSKLMECIGFEVTSIDKIITRYGQQIDEIIADLADLELQGMIKAVPGGYLRCAI